MAEYIDKSALVEEIERRRNICKKVVFDLRTEENNDYYQGKAEAYKETLSFLDTLEVKEVDLEKEVENFVQTKEFVESKESSVLLIAKHFYELGLKTK